MPRFLLAPLIGVGVGVAYGLTSRVLFGLDSNTPWGVMTVAFIFLVPAGLGAVTVQLAREPLRSSWIYALLMPWATTVATLVAAFATHLEGMICIVMIFPVFLLMSSLGGLGMWLVNRYARERGGPTLNAAALAAILVLPYVAAPVERSLGPEEALRVVDTRIAIRADAATVWAEIARVPPIRPEELRPSLAHAIGFPRPIEATLSHEGVGGVRHATFERGVLFVETVTEWEPERALAFTIAADPDQIPARALDQHVTVGGPYFDVLTGAYRIEPAESGGVVLHLRSTHRLSTTFNPYARLWTDWIMRDVQENILQVIRRRAEGVSTGAGLSS